MFKRILGNLLLMAFGGFLVSVAGATTLTIPNTFSPNTTIQSALVNGNFTTIASWANGNVDHGNIGAGGIFASQILPTNPGQAIFGGSSVYDFPSGLIVATNNDALVPLTVTGNSAGQSGDYFDVTKVGGSAGGIFKIDFSGNASILGAAIFLAPGGTCTSQVCITNDNNGGTNGLILNVPTGSTNGFQFNFNNTTLDKVTTDAYLQEAPLLNGLHTFGRVAPTYTAAGATLANTVHGVFVTLALVTNGNCLNATSCALTGNSATLTNAAIFTSAGTFSCSVTGQNLSSNGFLFVANPSSGSNLIIGMYNGSGSTVNTATTENVSAYCTGT